MGVGSSRKAEAGVAINPRVEYAEKLARKQGKKLLIDTPVLVDLNIGTVRYRYNEPGRSQRQRTDHTEKPHEGTENMENKQGYFYHVKLSDYSLNGKNEEPWKFHYVVKGSNNAQQKKLFYVFGKGLQNANSSITETKNEQTPHKTDYRVSNQQWPPIHKLHGHVYFDLYFLAQSEELTTDEHVDLREDIETSESKRIELVIKREDNTDILRKRLSVRLVKAEPNIHVFYKGQEISSNDVIGDLRETAIKQWKNFKIILEPK